MGVFAALDVSQDQTAICVVSENGEFLAEAKVATCPDTIADWLASWSGNLDGLAWRPGHWPSGFGTH